MWTVLTSADSVSAAHILAHERAVAAMSTDLFSPLALPSGLVLRNRIAKAAMEEGLAGRAQLPDERLASLYRRRRGRGGRALSARHLTVPTEPRTQARPALPLSRDTP